MEEILARAVAWSAVIVLLIMAIVVAHHFGGRRTKKDAKGIRKRESLGRLSHGTTDHLARLSVYIGRFCLSVIFGIGVPTMLLAAILFHAELFLGVDVAQSMTAGGLKPGDLGSASIFSVDEAIKGSFFDFAEVLAWGFHPEVNFIPKELQAIRLIYRSLTGIIGALIMINLLRHLTDMAFFWLKLPGKYRVNFSGWSNAPWPWRRESSQDFSSGTNPHTGKADENF